jgi:large subunit ribosomal protein L19
MNALELIAKDSLKPSAPVIEIGDTVRVHVKIVEGEKSRIQLFEGVVIAKKHGGVSETFTVRRVAHGVGVERVFPLHSPTVSKVEVISHGKVRRAKLYYLRDKVGKSAKIKTRI